MCNSVKNCFTVQTTIVTVHSTLKSMSHGIRTAQHILLLTPLGCQCLCLLSLAHQYSLEKLHSGNHYLCCMISQCRSKCLMECFYHDPCQNHLHEVISHVLYYLARVLPLPCLFSVSCHQALSHQVQVPAVLPLDYQSLRSQTFRLNDTKHILYQIPS